MLKKKEPLDLFRNLPFVDPTAKAGLMAVGDYGEGESKVGEKIELKVIKLLLLLPINTSSFEELTKMSDVKTQSGTPVLFYD